jgi:hypothetical protein
MLANDLCTADSNAAQFRAAFLPGLKHAFARSAPPVFRLARKVKSRIVPRERGRASFSTGICCLKFESEPCLVIARSTCDEAIQLSLSASQKLDYFAEPVIGRAFARPVGSQ